MKERDERAKSTKDTQSITNTSRAERKADRNKTKGIYPLNPFWPFVSFLSRVVFSSGQIEEDNSFDYK